MRLKNDVLWPAVIALMAGAVSFVLMGKMTATAHVVVAAQDLWPMSTISAGAVKIASLPTQSVHSKSFTDMNEVLGKRVLGAISNGQQITSDNLSDPGEGLRRWVSTGDVVMFVPMPVNRWLGGALSPGDLIDLVFCASPQKTGISLSRTVLSAKTVAATMGTQQHWDQAANEPAGLSLVLSSREAELVAFCLENGSLYACLASGTGTDAGDGVTIETITGSEEQLSWDW